MCVCALNALNKEILAAISKDERSGAYKMNKEELPRLLGESKVCILHRFVCVFSFLSKRGGTHQSRYSKNSFDGLYLLIIITTI